MSEVYADQSELAQKGRQRDEIRMAAGAMAGAALAVSTQLEISPPPVVKIVALAIDGIVSLQSYPPFVRWGLNLGRWRKAPENTITAIEQGENF